MHFQLNVRDFFRAWQSLLYAWTFQPMIRSVIMNFAAEQGEEISSYAFF
jgi:hypothetical protein